MLSSVVYMMYDEEIKRMMTILDDRRRQHVRNYVV